MTYIISIYNRIFKEVILHYNREFKTKDNVYILHIENEIENKIDLPIKTV